MAHLPEALSWFHLKEDPFAHACAEAYFAPTAMHSRALGSLRQTVLTEGGVVCVLGRPGSGKSLLARHFASTLIAPSATGLGYEPHIIDASRIDRSPLGLVRAFSASVGLKRRVPEYRIYDEIERTAIERIRAGARLVLIVDDAEFLSAAALESIQHLWNLVTPEGARFLVRIAVFAQPRIGRVLALPQLAALRSRISSTVQDLAPVDRDDLVRLIEHRLAVAGAPDGVVALDAIERVVELSDLTPGNCMAIAAAALQRAYAERHARVVAEHVRGEAAESAGHGRVA